VHGRHVADGRQVADRGLTGGHQGRGHQLEHAVLGADDVDLSGQLRAAGHSQDLH
jgi:hypothetical protein